MFVLFVLNSTHSSDVQGVRYEKRERKKKTRLINHSSSTHRSAIVFSLFLTTSLFEFHLSHPHDRGRNFHDIFLLSLGEAQDVEGLLHFLNLQSAMQLVYNNHFFSPQFRPISVHPISIFKNQRSTFHCNSPFTVTKNPEIKCLVSSTVTTTVTDSS